MKKNNDLLDCPLVAQGAAEHFIKAGKKEKGPIFIGRGLLARVKEPDTDFGTIYKDIKDLEP